QEPVRARLHRQPRVERGQGAAPGALGRDPQRHRRRRRRVRYLHERDAGRCAPRRQDLLHAQQPRGAPYSAENWRLAMRGALGFGLLALGVLLAPLSVNAQVANWPSESAPRPLAAKEFRFPPYEIRTLSNGMQVMVILHHEQPAVTMRLLTRAGAAQDPERKRGIAELVAHLLDQGTTTRSAQQIAEQIDFIGGAIGTGSGTDLTYVNAVVMKDSFAFGMDLIGDIVRNPAFSPEEIERQRERAISSLQVSDQDPDYVASVLFDRLVYGFHPYGLPGSGTPETLMNIRPEDLRRFHRQYFVPNNMILAIVGDVPGEDAF